MARIKGRNDGPNGRNEHYDVGSRTNIPRRKMVQEVKDGKFPNNHVVEINGQKYVRDNPDGTKRDNVNS